MKKIVVIILTILIIGSLIIFTVFKKDKLITEEEAKTIATSNVSNKNGNYEFNSVEFTQKGDIPIYTIEFSDNYNYYIYKINAKSKKIISSKKESLTNNKEYIDEKEILDIVFKHAKINRQDCNILSNLVTLEGNTPIYNPIFYYNNIKYSYKVNAYTGSIISVTKVN